MDNPICQALGQHGTEIANLRQYVQILAQRVAELESLWSEEIIRRPSAPSTVPPAASAITTVNDIDRSQEPLS